jgi:hypothetical protein
MTGKRSVVLSLSRSCGRVFIILLTRATISDALADKGRGSEHDNPRDECRHKGIHQDFVQNFGHCNLPVAAPLRRSSRALQYLGQKVTISCYELDNRSIPPPAVVEWTGLGNNRRAGGSVPDDRRACAGWCRRLHARSSVSVEHVCGARLAEPHMERRDGSRARPRRRDGASRRSRKLRAKRTTARAG